MNDNLKKEIDELGITEKEYYKYKLEVEIELKKIIKLIGRKMMMLSSLFIPICIFIFIVGSHSTSLFSINLLKFLRILFVIIVIIFLLGLILYIKNNSVNINLLINLKLRNFYLFFMTFYLTFVVGLLFIFYGPIKDFKKWIIKSDTINETFNYSKWIYSQKEIDEILNKNT